MKFKDEEAVGQILECAKEEFMQKGFVLRIRMNCFPRL